MTITAGGTAIVRFVQAHRLEGEVEMDRPLGPDREKPGQATKQSRRWSPSTKAAGLALIALAHSPPALPAQEAQATPPDYSALATSFLGEWLGETLYLDRSSGTYLRAPTHLKAELAKNGKSVVAEVLYAIPGDSAFSSVVASHDVYAFDAQRGRLTTTFNNGNGGSILKWDIVQLESQSDRSWRLVGFTTDSIGGALRDNRVVFEMEPEELRFLNYLKDAGTDDEEYVLANRIMVRRVTVD